MRNHSHTDVLVVGAGPAGLATAISAVTHGARVLVVERRAGTSTVPRATGLGTRSMEILREWGLTEAVLAGAIDVDPLIASARTLTARPDEEHPIGFPGIRESLRVSPTHPLGCPQDHLEPLLAAELVRRGGEVRFGCGLTTLDGHTATLTDGTRVHARFVVGADGPRSAVRAALGLGYQELGGWGEWELLLFRGVRAPSRHALFNVEGGGVLLPVGDGRWVHGRPVQGPEEPVVDRLRRVTGVPDLEPEVLARSRFGIGAAVASAMRVGDAFVIGDAAHRMTPAGGNGLNTALQDGHELGWRLGWAVRGWAGPELLASFAEEREPVGRVRARRSLMAGAAHAVDGLAGDLGWTYRSRTIAPADAGPSAWAGAGIEEIPAGTRTARPGERVPHAWVRVDGRRRAVLDLLGPGFTLLTADLRWRAAAQGQAVPVAVPEIVDPSGVLARRLRLGPGAGVLVRPDGVVVWRAEQPSRSALSAAVALGAGHSTTARAA
jgi:2-polyprenyl-6-methoxyphenol hydroxylase-like FAD-dependent oxidoreductase